MLVDLSQLRRRNEPLLVQEDFGERQLQLGSQIMALKRPVRSELRLSLLGDRVLVLGSVQADLQVTCSRCLKPFERTILKEFELEYEPDPAVAAEGEEFGLTYGDLSVGFYRNDQLDLSALVSEQIVLEIPMKPVCRPLCRGLCDQCGANLNEGDCNCEPQRVDPRWAALADLKKKME